MKFESVELTKLLTSLNSFHKIHGFDILANGPKSRQQIIWSRFIKTLIFLDILLILASGTSFLTTNNKVQRIMSLMVFSTYLELLLEELLFSRKKKVVFEVVEWCHYVEMKTQNVCHKPEDWFVNPRVRVNSLIQ